MAPEYIKGECTFLGMTFNVRPPVIIPVSHTERMVERICQTEDRSGTGRFLEVGPGCGAICLSLLNSFPEMSCVAVDINKEACDQTLENAEKYGFSDRIEVHNIPIDEYPVSPTSPRFDFIVSNPPMFPASYSDSLPVHYTGAEKVALYGGQEGVDIMRDILQLSKDILINGGSLWMKMMSNQPAIIESMVQNSPALNAMLGSTEVYPDQCNKERSVFRIRRV